LASFKLDINDGPLDLHRIATSGQMFRWTKTDTGYLVSDGSQFHLVQELERGALACSSSEGAESLHRLIRLDTNHHETLQEIVRRGPELEPYLNLMQGLRLMRPSGTVETLFSFICSANNHVSRITSLVWKLAGYGERTQFEDKEAWRFPVIEQLITVTESELRANGFGYRGATIPNIAKTLQERGAELFLEQLKSQGYQNARTELMNMKGLGPKLADCICLFGFDFGESVPIDTHIWQQLTRLYFPDWQDTNLTHAKYDYAANFFRDRFGELAGAAHQFLFVENMQNWRAKAKGLPLN
jgi:N-glycosylase/DNA lyase